jgi:hypothetical protein
VIRGRALLVVLLGASIGACRGLPLARPAALPECPGPLRATGEIEGDFLLRARIRLAAGAIDAPLQLAVEKRGDVLVLVGFDPFGAKLFTVRQRGRETEVEALPAPVLPVPPRNVLRDLHRVRFLGLARPDAPDAELTEVRDGTRIAERWQAGVLRSRRFERLDGSGVVHLEFPPPGAEPPGVVSIHNEACGYEATWVDVAEDVLR